MEEEQNPLKFTRLDTDIGIDIGKRRLKTAEGVIITPKEKKKEKPKEKQESLKKPQETVAVSKSSKALAYEEVIFSTAIGEMKASYFPVIDTDEYIVLGLGPNSFIPKPYKESPDLRFKLVWKDVSSTVVFTGCKFKDPATGSEYIIMMKVKE